MDSTTPLKWKVPGAIPSDDDFFSNKNTRFSGFFQNSTIYCAEIDI